MLMTLFIFAFIYFLAEQYKWGKVWKCKSSEHFRHSIVFFHRKVSPASLSSYILRFKYAEREKFHHSFVVTVLARFYVGSYYF